MKKVILIFYIIPLLSVFAQDTFVPLSEQERTFIVTQNAKGSALAAVGTNKPSYNSQLTEIIFILRMPQTWNLERDKALKDKRLPSVRGVIALCSEKSDSNAILYEIARRPGAYIHLLDFADANNLAIVAWTNFGAYTSAASTHELDKKNRDSLNSRFEARSEDWEKGIKKILNHYNLPDNGIMGYGLSGGAQILHRLAMRKSKYFSGVFIHVNSSYDEPTKSAANILWCVSTGELEAGYPAAERFYNKMIDLGYCAIFKAEENLGHTTNAHVYALSEAFFTYLITFLPDPLNKDWKAPPVDKFYLMRNPIYIGDYVNQIAFPFEEAKTKVPKKFMVALPTEPLAKAWGNIMK